jgi:hypothetical protein
MKHFLMITAVVMSILSFAMPAMAEKATPTQTVTGTLSVEKNDDGVIVKANLTTSTDSKTVYNVVLDKDGKNMAATIADKKVEVTGTIAKKEIETKDEEGNTVKSTELWLTVKSFKAVVETETEDSE